MSKLKELENDVAKLAAELKPFALKEREGTLTDDESRDYDAKLDTFNTVSEQFVTQRQRDANAAAVLQADQDFNQPNGKRVSGLIPQQDAANDGGDGRQWRSVARRFLESEEYKEAKRNPKGVSGQVQVDSFHSQPDIRALIGSATPAASALFPQVFPNIYRAAEKPLVMRDVLLNLQTQSDSLTIMTESGFTNAAAPVAEPTVVGGAGLTGGVKPESALTFTETTFPVRWIGHWIPITRQLIQDTAFMEGYINGRLIDGLKRAEDAQFISGDGVAPNLTGILTTSGIQVLDATYFTGAPVKDAATANENANRIRRAITKIMTTGDATPTFIVANPADVEDWDTVTDAQRNYLFGGPARSSTAQLWGTQVVQSQGITAKTALVGDGTMAAVVDRQDAVIYTTDSHSDYFIRNILTVLAEERVALPVFRPVAFAKVTLV
jgi:HK97 family phage major capsid protein